MHIELIIALILIVGMFCQWLAWQRYVNISAAIHFQADFGSRRIFSLAAPGDIKKTDKHRISESYQGSLLFGDDITYSDMVRAVSSGRQVKSTRLSEEFNWQTYLDKYKDTRLPLFVINNKGMVEPFTANHTIQPESGSIILALDNVEETAAESA